MKDSVQKAYCEWIDDIKIRNGVNVTLTLKSYVNGFQLDEVALSRNIRYFTNFLNTRIFGNAFRRFDKRLDCFFVYERNGIGDLHVHGIIERPDRMDFEEFRFVVLECWRRTLFGNERCDIKNATTTADVVAWKRYIMKRRSKSKLDFSGLIDLENSSCLNQHRL